MLTGHLKAEEITGSENSLKAVCLYNFLIFISWPSFPQDKITIGILGDDPLDGVFNEVHGRPVRGTNLPLQVKYFGPFRKGINLSECQLIYIGASERRHYKQIMEHVNNGPVLTVSEHNNFLDAGGMINLVIFDNNMRWEIDRSNVETAGLSLSAQLLKSAIRVVP